KRDGAPLPLARRGRRAPRRGLAGPRFHDAVEREQAAARRAVVAGAEGEACLDFEADAVGAHTGARVRGMDDEAARLHRGEAFQAVAHPVHWRERLEAQRLRRLHAGERCDERAHGRRVRRLAEIDGDRPASGGVLESRGGDLVCRRALGDGVGDSPRGGGIAREARDYGGVASWRRLRHELQVLDLIPTIHSRLATSGSSPLTEWSTTYAAVVHKHRGITPARWGAYG